MVMKTGSGTNEQASMLLLKRLQNTELSDKSILKVVVRQNINSMTSVADSCLFPPPVQVFCAESNREAAWPGQTKPSWDRNTFRITEGRCENAHATLWICVSCHAASTATALWGSRDYVWVQAHRCPYSFSQEMFDRTLPGRSDPSRRKGFVH